MMLNTNLGPTLEQIFEDPNSLKNLSAALGNVSIESSNITMENATVLGKLPFYLYLTFFFTFLS